MVKIILFWFIDKVAKSRKIQLFGSGDILGWFLKSVLDAAQPSVVVMADKIGKKVDMVCL